MVETYLAIGYAAADPFVAALQSDPVWDDVSVHEDCPDADYIDAAGRLMALSNRTAGRFAERLEFQDCYDSDQATEIERKLGIVLDQAVRTFGYENGGRSEEHTSELQSLMRNASDDFCLKKKKHRT